MVDRRPSNTPIIFTRVSSSAPTPSGSIPPSAVPVLPVATATPVLLNHVSPKAAAAAHLNVPPPIPPKPLAGRQSSMNQPVAGLYTPPAGSVDSPKYEPSFSLSAGVTPPSYSEAKRMLEASDRASGFAVGDQPLSTSPPGGPVTGDTSPPPPSLSPLQVDGVDGAAPEGVPNQGATLERLTNVLGRIEPLVQLEERTGIGRLYLAVVIAIVLCLLFVAIFGVTFFSSIIAFVYPAYMSYKSLERNLPDEHLHWLIYWVVYGVFHLLEPIIDAMLLGWVPMYRFGKLLFLVWCFLPQTRGCSWLYAHTIRPILHANESNIDAGLVKLNHTFGQVTREVREMAGEIMAAVVAQMFGAMTSIRLPSENRGNNGNGQQQRDERKLL